MIPVKHLIYRLRLKLNKFMSNRVHFSNLSIWDDWQDWSEIDFKFQQLSQDENFIRFRRNQLLLETMEYKNFDAEKYSADLDHLGIREPRAGKPILPFGLRNSLNLGHQYRHVTYFNEFSKNNLVNIDRIVEFGAGYGCMRWLLSELNHKGSYFIIDNPGVSELQKRYLRSSVESDSFMKTNWSASMQNLEINLQENDLFIALWSLSEVSTKLMEQVLGFLENSECRLLIAFQNTYNGRDNFRHFSQYFKNAARIPISYPEGNLHSTYIIR
jgi:hypothetical protein